nr:M13 family metallopeptidase [Hankyongella ginsenosidimutans]
MDEARIEQLGMTPLAADFAEVDAVKTQADLVALLGRWERQGLPTPFGFFINQDEKKPDQYAVYLGQGGIGLPDRDYYLEDKFKDAREIQSLHCDRPDPGRVRQAAGTQPGDLRARGQDCPCPLEPGREP